MTKSKFVKTVFFILSLSICSDLYGQFKAGVFNNDGLQSEKNFSSGLVFLSLSQYKAMCVVEYDITIENGEKVTLFLDFETSPTLLWQNSEYQIYFQVKPNDEGILSVYLTQDDNFKHGIIFVYSGGQYLYYTGSGVRWSL